MNMDVTGLYKDLFSYIMPKMILPIIGLIFLVVILSVLKVLTARKRAQEQIQRDIEEAIYFKEVDRIAQAEYNRRHSSSSHVLQSHDIRDSDFYLKK